MNYHEKMEELYDYIENFKREFAEIENLNPNYLNIFIDDCNHIIISPTVETGIIYSYRN